VGRKVFGIAADGDKRQFDIALGLPGYEPSRHRVAAFKELEMVRLVVPHEIVRDASQDIPFELWVHTSTRKLLSV
jgi:hypothetical protein